MALSLGRITVQSALGEPLRAEIDIPDINADEAASLKASIALPEAFKAAGLEYSPVMAGVQATVQRRADGRTYIRLSSDRAINDPFVDLILEANWATGRIVRDYTMLFDPPGLRQAMPVAPTPAQVSPPSSSRAAAPAPSPATAARPATRASVAPAPASSATGQVTVKPGDTAGKIARAAKPANVSLDQMLVALLRTNPAAFAGDNVNRVKAGSVIKLPTAEQAAAAQPSEATQIIVAQSKDFNEYRRKLAGSAPGTQVATAEREVSGRVQTQVEDKKPATKAPDKLTLSKGSVQGKLAQDQLAKEAASRAAELSKNINDLSKLGAASSAAASGLTASAALSAKAATATVTAVVESPKPPASAAVTASAAPAPAPSVAASTPVAQTASAPQPAASSPAKRVIAKPAVPPEPSMLDALMENPLLPAGAAGLIALLAGLGFYRRRQHKNKAQLDSVLQESHLQPESFFGASGGQNVDTNDSAATGSAMVYSPSQLDAADDVDPVAEADVYLAYGRDLQAEEILRTALDVTPERIAIHQKLLEILAKRQDVQGFESIAALAFKISGGDGLDWMRICELGQSIDPGNTLYRPGGQPAGAQGIPATQTPPDYTSTLAESASSLATQAIAPQPSSTVDLDLDLDFSLDEEPASVTAESGTSKTEAAPSVIDMDFGLVTEKAPEAAETAPAAAISDAIDFSLPSLEVTSTELTPESAASPDATAPMDIDLEAASVPPPLESSEPKPASKPDLDMLEFDLGSLSLDLGDEPKPEDTPPAGSTEDPLATKLALAEEFSAIGDDDGARALIEEVIAEASGDMKLKAQRALSNL